MCPLAESLNKINAVSQVQADGKQELYYLHIGSPSTLACTEVPGSEVIHVVHFLNVCVDSGGSGGDACNLNSSGCCGGVCGGGLRLRRQRRPRRHRQRQRRRHLRWRRRRSHQQARWRWRGSCGGGRPRARRGEQCPRRPPRVAGWAARAAGAAAAMVATVKTPSSSLISELSPSSLPAGGPGRPHLYSHLQPHFLDWLSLNQCHNP